MHKIGDFSKMAKTTVKTLRYYDVAGLLKPHFVDDETGYRYYATQQLVPLQHITALRQAGLSVEEIRSVLSGEDIVRILNSRKSAIKTEIRSAQEQLSRLDSILFRKKGDFFMDYQAIIKELPACTVYYKQGRIPGFQAIQDFIVQAGEECRAANPGLKCLEPDYCFVSYLDPEFKPVDIALEYAQAVNAVGKETQDIHFKKLDSVTAVCVYHKGAYDLLGEAYAFAFNWVEQNGYTPIESAREYYIDGVWNKENPADWLTEIQIPVAKK